MHLVSIVFKLHICKNVVLILLSIFASETFGGLVMPFPRISFRNIHLEKKEKNLCLLRHCITMQLLCLYLLLFNTYAKHKLRAENPYFVSIVHIKNAFEYQLDYLKISFDGKNPKWVYKQKNTINALAFLMIL